MTTFQLDTSGRVACTDPHKPCICHTATWDRLTPFAQGYVEAALLAFDVQRHDHYIAERRAHRAAGVPVRASYQWLAPETLARIIQDCERLVALGAGDTVEEGRTHWRLRQEVSPFTDTPAFPPLTVTLGDDGKVYFREAQQ